MGHVMKYSEQLQDPRWISKRFKILKRDHFKCSECNSTHNLNVHHKYYVRGKKAWEYPYNVLITLCSNCHSKWHKEHDIEIRDEVWKKNREYIVPLKKSHKNKKRVEDKKHISFKINKPKGLDYITNKKAEIRVRKKKELIEKYMGKFKVLEMYNKLKSMTLEELETYLKNYSKL